VRDKAKLEIEKATRHLDNARKSLIRAINAIKLIDKNGPIENTILFTTWKKTSQSVKNLKSLLELAKAQESMDSLIEEMPK